MKQHYVSGWKRVEHLTDVKDSACSPTPISPSESSILFIWLEVGDLTDLPLPPSFWPKTK